VAPAADIEDLSRLASALTWPAFARFQAMLPTYQELRLHGGIGITHPSRLVA
jgi:hypothetical protein